MERLRYFVLLWLLICFVSIASTQEKEGKIFGSFDEYNSYVFGNSDLRTLTNGYLLNYVPEMTPDEAQKLFSLYDKRVITRESMLNFITLLERTDVSRQLKADSLLFPVMNEVFSNDGKHRLRIPIFITDITMSYLNKESFDDVIMKHKGEHPFDGLTKNQIGNKQLSFSGLFVDTLVNNHISIYWNRESFISNTRNRVENLRLILDKDTFNIAENEGFALDDYYGYTKPLQKLKILVTFTDGTSNLSESNAFFLKYDEKEVNPELQPKAGNTFPWAIMNGGLDQTSSIGDDPRLDFAVLWGCDPNGKKTLNKPFILVAGWGPYTGVHDIDNAQGWPSTIEDFYWSVNQKGYIDSLVGDGFDVVFAKFFPPNASAVLNSYQLENLINAINTEKFSQGAYEENIISGYSAGSMCVRLTLERMEYNHLNYNGNHHHCKLFVSFDGEQGGANVPLGLQHAVKYLRDFHSVADTFPNYTIYALHYILNAPLSKELLHYFYTETGTQNNPGQGPHPQRTSFLQFFNAYNHSKNTQNPGYPAFTRNISISNGTSHRTANSPLSTYYPYAPENGKEIFYNKKVHNILLFPFGTWIEKSQIHLLGRMDGMVFKDEYKPLYLPWTIRMEAYTSNPLILDNAPGGTTFLADPGKCADQNIMYQVLRRMEVKTQPFFGVGNADFVAYDAMYSFTPTLLTHDIRNFTPTYAPGIGGGLPYYDMRAEGLMFTKSSDVGDVQKASSYYGYPHLAHPSDHYMSYTPFDAVFAWEEENTVHIQSGHAFWNDNKENGCSQGFFDFFGQYNPKHKRWEQYDSPIRDVMKSFILGEADAYNTFVQNRRYGDNASPNAIYKADIISKHQLYAGENVTQRTDFKEVTIEPNADVQFVACEAIHLKPGFHAKAGSKFHAYINTASCYYCTYSGLVPADNNHNRGNSHLTLVDGMNTVSGEEELFKLYPNPTTERAIIEIIDNLVNEFSFEVSDISGKLIQKGEVVGREYQLSLDKGIYIIKINTETSWESKKLIVY